MTRSAETEGARLAEEQAALRRVAALVAGGIEPGPLFDALAGEIESLFGGDISAVVRYEGDGSVTVMGAHGGPHGAGARAYLDPDYVVALVYRTRRAASFELERSATEAPAIVRDWGVRSAVATPVIVDGQLWGAITVASCARALGAGTDRRLADFSALFAIAIANAQSREALAALAEEQGALRRVATLVAEGVDAQDVFDAVCRETGQLLKAATVNLSHYTPDGIDETISGWSLSGAHLPVGTRLPIESGTVGDAILRTRAPARVDDWDQRTNATATRLRELGVRSSLGAPILVGGRLWGALLAGTDREEPLPPGTEFRLARFTDLLTTAISNAATRSELIASRARLVAAGDEARRRIERDLHDGTQQRLIALGLDLRRIRATIPDDLADARLGLQRAEDDLAAVLDELRELSRGLHPPLLARRGLRTALRTLAHDSPIPVQLEIDLHHQAPEPLEVAVYYVVSEALTNAVKHSRASVVSITIETDPALEPFGAGLDGRGGPVNLHATIADDGIGGADPGAGSGLAGLADRVDALGGRFALDSPGGGGTRISIELPIS